MSARVHDENAPAAHGDLAGTVMKTRTHSHARTHAVLVVVVLVFERAVPRGKFICRTAVLWILYLYMVPSEIYRTL